MSGLNFIKLISKKKIKYLNIDKITYASTQKYLKFKDYTKKQKNFKLPTSLTFFTPKILNLFEESLS